MAENKNNCKQNDSGYSNILDDGIARFLGPGT
jgi:hypothetical protein